jgi:outer membrane protein OmpA-like peptidoglycan-associated protein
MRNLILLAVVGAVAIAAPSPSETALAQATIDQRALNPLNPSQPGTAPAEKPASPAKPGTQRPAAPTAPTAPVAPAPPSVPKEPPPGPVIPPPIVVPTRPPEPPPPPPVNKDAQGTAAPAQGVNLRVTFGADSSDINPATDAAVRALTSAPDGSTFTVTSFAAGTPDDPSTARRLSLARGLAVRSVLINAGIASPRIYVRALGAASPEMAGGPADRVDILVTPPQQPPTPAPKANP